MGKEGEIVDKNFTVKENELVKEEEMIKGFDDLGRIERLQHYVNLLDEDYFRALEHLSNEKMYNSQYKYYEEFEQNGKTDFLEELETYFPEISRSNGSRFYKKLDYNIGIICDEFVYNAYKDSANIKYISADSNVADSDFDFVIIVSSWRGIDGSWAQVASPRSDKREKLMNMVSAFKKSGIPTAFYSKEDPVNFHLFKDIAKECDVIYTSAVEMVEKYKEYCNNDNVHVMEFGVNPRYHNPVGSRTQTAEQNKDHVLFAGSWTEKYPVRNNESARMFDGVKENGFDLTIVDRNLELRKTRYQFPKRYIENLTYPMEHNDLMDTHRLIPWAINVNSVKYSETMFANRVFELQAMGNLMLTNYSMGVNNKFPNLFIVNTKADVKPMLNNHSENEYEDLRAKGIRQVMLNETGFHRVSQFAENFGLQSNIDEKKILVVASDVSAKIQESFDRQMYENKNLINEDELTKINISDYDFITYFSDEFIYEEYHLEDLLSAFVYTDVDFVTKQNTNLHDYSQSYENLSLTMFDITVLNNSFRTESENGYVIPMTEVMTDIPEKTNSEKLVSVIVPIHNNGRYLEDKCFRSLTRSSIFDKMEIIFINDGSTDPETISIINRLRRRYPDVVYVEFPEGSGSASRPRNEGAKIVKTPYLTYLDPDNEASGDGYADLLDKLIKNPELDMAVGNIMKEDNKRRATFKYSGTVKKFNNKKLLIEDTHKFMEESALRAQSIQALIVKTNIIQDNNIEMVEGAAGQDTVFFQELILNCHNVIGVETFVHMYYAAVSGSVTNTIGKKFFDKYYKLEIERIPFLKEHNLLETYLNERFNFYVKGWYLSRIDRIKPEERHDAITRFLDIYSLYDQYDKVEDNDLLEQIESLKNEVNYKG